MYRYLLENQTSEQASRILSMQMANDNAIKLLKNLQLEYNKLRQQNITAELMDIVGGSIEWFICFRIWHDVMEFPMMVLS